MEWTFAGAQTGSMKKLEDAIRGVEALGGFTNPVEAIEAATQQVFGKRGDR